LNFLDWLWQILEGRRAPLASGLIALAITAGLTPFIKKVALKYGAMDDPSRDARRVHKEPIPKWGGIAIYGGLLVSLLITIPYTNPLTTFPNYLLGILLIGGGIVVMGALDDVKDYSSKIQLAYLLFAGVAIQFLFDGAGRVQIQGISLPIPGSDPWIAFPVWVAVPITAFYIFLVSKTMDTIDGVDGLAAGIAAIAAATLAIIAYYEGQPRVALVAAAIAGASLGFLFHNFNPARIFMGTGGAQLLGFCLAALSVVGALKTAAALAILIPILVFGVPLFDMIFVVARRAMSGDPIMQADKRHLHHTLLKSGLSQKQTVLVLYSAAIILCGLLVFLVVSRGEAPTP
jgi:UDP-GlcNAc:undecaprenyl-phosphate/decaprenyl-phosphate GlcNAc-1-phosphate transferase